MLKLFTLLSFFVIIPNIYAQSTISSQSGGDWGNTATWAGGVIPGSSDSVVIVSGHSVTLNQNAACRSLLIQTTGSLTYANSGNINLSVSDNFSILGNFQTSASGTSTNHICEVGNLAVSGSMDLFTNSGNAAATLTFSGNSNTTFSGNGNVDLYMLQMNKGSGAISPSSPLAEIQLSSLTIRGNSIDSSGFIIPGTWNGILKLSGNNTFKTKMYHDSILTIPSTGGFWLNNPNAEIFNGSGNAYVSGLMHISYGKWTIGQSYYHNLNLTGNAYFIQDSGYSYIHGGLAASSTVTFQFYGGISEVAINSMFSPLLACFNVTSLQAQVTLSGGTIELGYNTGSGGEWNCQAMPTGTIGTTVNTRNNSATAYTYRMKGYLPNFRMKKYTVNHSAYPTDSLYILGTTAIETGLKLNVSGKYLEARNSISGAGTLKIDSTGAIFKAAKSSGTLSISCTVENNRVYHFIAACSTSFPGAITCGNTARFLSGHVSAGGTFTLGLGGTNSFTYERADGTHPSATEAYGTGANHFIYSGTGSSNAPELPTTITTGSLTISNTCTITLTAALTLPKLYMYGGKLITTASNILKISDTAQNAVVWTDGWVSGPMRRRLPWGMNIVDRNRVYLFPVGKSTYGGFEMVTPITRNAVGFGCFSIVNPEIHVECFDANAGGSGGTNFTSLRTDRYWYYTISQYPCAFYSSGLRVYDAQAHDSLTMGTSTSASGTYNNIGGFKEGFTIGGTQPIYPSTYSNNVYIVLGGKPTLAGGTYTVGASRNYTKLTSVANILHSRILTGDCLFEFYDDYDGTTGEVIPFIFWPWVNQGGDWKVTLRPHSSNSTTIQSIGNPADPSYHAYNWALFSFEGTRNLIVDGRKGGTGSTPAWLFRNSATSEIGPVFRIQNDAAHDTVRYIIMEGQMNNTGMAEFGYSNLTKGNDSNCYAYNTLRRRTDVGGTNYLYGVMGAGSVLYPANYNDDNAIIGNRIEDPRISGIVVNNIANGSRWKIKDNHIYSAVSHNVGQVLIDFVPEMASTQNEIAGNFLGGNAYGATGMWTNSGSGMSVRGIRFSADTNSTHVIANNIIRNIYLSSTSTSGTFNGMYIMRGKIAINSNVIGTLTADTGILSLGTGTMYGIYTDTLVNLQINQNIIANIRNTNMASSNTIMGIRFNASKNSPNIYQNQIQNIGFGPLLSTTNGLTVVGIHIASTDGWTQGRIYNNTIKNLFALNNGANSSTVRGIYLAHPAGTIQIFRNRLCDFLNPATGGSPEIQGIHILDGNTQIRNNQISLTNTGNTNGITMLGILDNSGTTNTSEIYHNTIYIGGTAASGAFNSSGIRRQIASLILQKNNIYTNFRTGGTGVHSGIWNSSGATNWTTTSSMHNLLVVPDTTKATIWGGSNNSNTAFRANSGGDSTSWIYTQSAIPADSLFQFPDSNLNIRTDRSYHWLVQGRGTQLSNVQGDYSDSTTIRASVVTDGAPDIGADEVSPNQSLLPPALSLTGTHSNSQTEIAWQGGRKIAEISWGASGTLPTLGNLYYFTGVWPNDTNNNGNSPDKKYGNAYLRIDTSVSSAGNNYTYTLKIHYDHALMGKLANESLLILAKKTTGINGTWDSLASGASRNTSANIVVANNSNKLRSFSEFVLTENSSNALPLVFIHFTKNSPDQIQWEVNPLSPADQFVLTFYERNGKLFQKNINIQEGKQIYSESLPDMALTGVKIHATRKQQWLEDGGYIRLDASSSEHLTTIYPNPSLGSFRVKRPLYTESAKGILRTLDGRICWEGLIQPGETSLQFSLPSGLYFLQIIDEIKSVIETRQVYIILDK